MFEGTGPTPGSYMRVKLGVDQRRQAHGRRSLAGLRRRRLSRLTIGPGCMCVFSCYDIPNARVDGYDVCVNKPQTKAYRAPGATHAAFACETVIDEICEKLSIDPIEFRLKNAARKGRAASTARSIRGSA